MVYGAVDSRGGERGGDGDGKSGNGNNGKGGSDLGLVGRGCKRRIERKREKEKKENKYLIRDVVSERSRASDRSKPGTVLVVLT